MGLMASWTDGPEYAPRERPAAFVVPAAAPLAVPAAPAVAPPAPEAEPSFAAPQATQPDLAALVPSGAPGRNPKVAFEVTAAAITAGGPSPAGGPLRSPTQPFTDPGPPITGYLPAQPVVQPNAQVNPVPFPTPHTPQWFAPPPESRVPAAPPPVTVAQIWRAATPGVLIPLLIGMLFSWLSILLLFMSFVLSARIAYRRAAVRRAYSVAMVLIGLNGMLSALTDGYSSTGFFDVLSGGAQIACLALVVVIPLIVGAALRAGERPDRTG
jgi:hypothetical protein